MAEMFPTGHSPLGASGAPRWLKCRGSVALAQGHMEEDFEDDTFSAPGTMAHSVAAWCLESGKDAWELMKRGDAPGEGYTLPDGNELFADKEMADAVQVYLNRCREEYPQPIVFGARDIGVEHSFHCPTIHPLFYGTADWWRVYRNERTLRIRDYKHGAGIVVDVRENAPTMYYACGVLESFGLWNDIDRVILEIVQPRGFHFDGPIREWECSTDHLLAWMEETLIPGMNAAVAEAEKDPVLRDTKSGEHCRFCPVRFRACPQHFKDMARIKELIAMIDAKGGAEALTDEQAVEFKNLQLVLKIKAAAVGKVLFGRLQAGNDKIPKLGWHLVKARSNREWKPDATSQLKTEFGKRAWTEPELKSPAQIDELPGGKKFTTRWAQKPNKGLTLAAVTDGRVPIARKSATSVFKDRTKQAKGA